MAKDRDVIKKVLGDPNPFTWGQNRSSSGMGIVGARAAGVVKDTPPPPAWLELAATLPNAPQESSKSPKAKFAARFHIAGHEAHITLDKFYELMADPENRHRLKDIGVTTLHIEEPNLEGSFEFTGHLPADWTTEPSVMMNVIYKDGLSPHLGGETRMAISIGQRLMGILTVDKIGAGLATHANEMSASTSVTHNLSDKKKSYLTVKEFFVGRYSLSSAWHKADKSAGIEIINDIFEPHLIGKSLGTLYHAGEHPNLVGDCMRMDIETLETFFHSHTPNLSREAYLGRIFGPAVMSIGILDTQMKRILAILTPPDDFSPQRK